MPDYRSKTSTHGRNMAGARALWRATGMKDDDFKKPIIAIANSFTQFVPGHVHLKDLGQLVAREIERAGGVAKEFNTIAVDDGIAMGHDGMLYSLPSREIIADTSKTAEVLIALSADSREAVDALADAALANGGSVAGDSQDFGYMYGRSFLDPDGHQWEVNWLDLSQAPATPGA